MAEIRLTKSNKPEHKLRRFVAGTGLGIAALSAVGIAVHENAEKQVVNQSEYALTQVNQVDFATLKLEAGVRVYDAPDTEGHKTLTDGISKGNEVFNHKITSTTAIENPIEYVDPDGDTWFGFQEDYTSTDSVAANVQWVHGAVLDQYDVNNNGQAFARLEWHDDQKLVDPVSVNSLESTNLHDLFEREYPVGHVEGTDYLDSIG